MKFSLLVQAAPTSPASHGALRFAETVLSQGHELYRVFFYGDGVLNGSNLHDQGGIPQRWQQLGKDNNLDLTVCITAALKRGVIDEDNARRLNIEGHNLLSGFDLSGLGQLADASINADRIISFG